MAVNCDGFDDYNSYVTSTAGFPFTIPVTIFLRYKFSTAIGNSNIDQPLFSVAEPTAIATSGTSFQIAKNAANQFIAKSQRVGDPVAFSGLNTASSVVVSANTWHAVVAQFDATSIKLWVNGSPVVNVEWNRNNSIVNLTWAAIGGVYLFGGTTTNVKPSTSNANAYYGQGAFSDVGVVNGTFDPADLASYLTGNYSCAKMYESYGGVWKFLLLDTLPAGTSTSVMPPDAVGATISYSNFAATGSTQTNGPTHDTDWPSLLIPSAGGLPHMLQHPPQMVFSSVGRWAGV